MYVPLERLRGRTVLDTKGAILGRVHAPLVVPPQGTRSVTSGPMFASGCGATASEHDAGVP